MGVSGLLPLLKSIQKPCSLKKFAGRTIGVDAYGWLHRGTIACAIELAQGKPTQKWINFVMGRVRMLVHFGIKPYMIFDGDYLPSKSGTEKERAARRKESRKNGLELLRLGRTSQAHLELQKSIDVTPEMARQLIEELKRAKIDYVVAPYEADAQLAYLERIGIIDAILSEDSDLLVFGTQCLLTKLDQYGDCIMINRKDFTACRDISLVGWTDADFRLMAILSGCDYLSSIDKMGLKTAYRLIRKHKTVDKLIRAVQFDGKMKVPPGYLEAFNRAEATFLYQWVYCPRAQRLINFSEPDAGVDLANFPCIGKFVEPHLAIGVAKGDLHPHTKEPIVLPSNYQAVPRGPGRNSTVMRTPDLKAHKSIDSFFKPSRTPLAELDPNIFTPSPSQLQLLQQGPAPWSAEPIHRRPLMTRDSPSIPASAPHRLRRAVTDLMPPPTQSPKRQRLCSDGFYVTPSNKNSRVESGASRFFATKTSSSHRKGREQNAANEFNLWSDDSVEEAMSQLPEQDNVRPKSNKKLSIFKDEESLKGVDNKEANSESSPTPCAAGDDDVRRDSSPKPSKSNEESVFTHGLAANVELLRFRYSSAKGEVKLEDTVKRPYPRAVSAPLATAVPCSPPAEILENERVDAGGSGGGDGFDEADWKEAESRPLDKLSGHDLPESQTTEADEPQLKGSEDLLVPDSEGEEEEIKSTGFSFDLARFAFAG